MFNFIFPIFHIHVHIHIHIHIHILALLLLTPTGSSRSHSTYLSCILVTHHGGLIAAGFILFLPTPTVHGHHAGFVFMHVLLLQLKFVVVVVVVGGGDVLMNLGYFNIHQLLWDWL